MRLRTVLPRPKLAGVAAEIGGDPRFWFARKCQGKATGFGDSRRAGYDTAGENLRLSADVGLVPDGRWTQGCQSPPVSPGSAQGQ